MQYMILANSSYETEADAGDRWWVKGSRVDVKV